jgi:uncharacterized DUF497 family protein
MVELTFEWDARKNRANRTKQGVTFEEERKAFIDDLARVVPDSGHGGSG